MKSFIVDFWSKIFGFLSWISPFQIIRTFFPRIKEPGAVELWVLVNLVISVLLLLPSDEPGWSRWEIFLVTYCALHIFEVVIYQINVLLFDAYRKRKSGKKYHLRGYRRLVLLLLQNYIELIFWFAVIYRHMSVSFMPSTDSFGQALSVSFSAMSGFGAASTAPAGGVIEVILQIQAAVGFFMALLVLARFVSIIPQPDTADKIERTEK